MYASKETVKKIYDSFIKNENDIFGTKKDDIKSSLNTFKEQITHLNMLKMSKAQRGYQEGEPISDFDLKTLNQVGANVIKNFSGLLLKELNKGEDDVDLATQKEEYKKQMLKVADYLFITALYELGCPDIPEFFGDDGKRLFTTFIDKMKTDDYSEIDTDTQFDLQRKKSANKVRTATSEYFNHTEENPISPADLAKFTAEYQALKLRQAGHGRVWRFFHRGENGRRKELLADMKAKIEEYIGNANIDIDSDSPETVGENFEKACFRKEVAKEFTKDGFALRNGYDVNIFKHEENNQKKEEIAPNEIDANQKIKVEFKENDIGGALGNYRNPSIILADDDEEIDHVRYISYK